MQATSPAPPPRRTTRATGMRTGALILSWTRRDFDARYRRSALAALWAVIQPFAVVAVYAFIFGVIFDQSGGDIPYLSYLLGGMIVFRIVSNCLSQNTCFTDNYDVIAHSAFPRYVIPLSLSLGVALELVVTVPSLVVVGALQGITPTYTLLAVPFILAGVLALAAGACIVVSTVQVFVRDLQFVVSFGVTALFFASPISYQPEQLPEGLQWLNSANPISVYIQALRDTVLLGHWPSWPILLLQMACSVALLGLAIAHLQSVGHRIVDLG
ncbi:ABC transporter permease [Aquihabitans sp. McL0605]|uniref:ABC transporter permease n=1 Tax=Aquihabitans sp. McL0605 TaxID=3415671 RepID=UPI003CFB0283